MLKATSATMLERMNEQGPNDRVTFRRKLRAEPSRIERALWSCLRDRRFHNLKFRRQHSIGPFVADFYCDALNLVIEADGSVHEEADQKRFDQERDLWMLRNGLIVVRVKEDLLLTAPDLALRQIETELETRGFKFR